MDISEIIKGYNKIAKDYDKLAIGDSYRAFSKLAKLGLEIYHKKKAQVLDLACGTGLSSIEFFKKNFEIIGIDISQQMLNQAQKYPYKKLIRQNIERPLKVKDNYFDIVTLTGAMEFVSRPFNLFTEIKKKMKNDGIFLLTVPKKYPKGSFLREKLHRHSYSKEEIRKIFDKAKLKIIKFKQIFGYYKQIKGKKEKSYFYCYILKKII